MSSLDGAVAAAESVPAAVLVTGGLIGGYATARVTGVRPLGGVVCPAPKGAFSAYPSVMGLLGGEVQGVPPSTTTELAALFCDKAEVAVVPGEAFGPSGFLRLYYAMGDDDLAEGLRRLQEFLGSAAGAPATAPWTPRTRWPRPCS